MSFFGNLHAMLAFMGHFWPIGIVCFIALKAGGGYVPPPNGGPGGDMGMGKTVKKEVQANATMNGIHRQAACLPGRFCADTLPPAVLHCARQQRRPCAALREFRCDAACSPHRHTASYGQALLATKKWPAYAGHFPELHQRRLGLVGVWDRADAAAALSALLDFGSLRTLPAADAALEPVCLGLRGAMWILRFHKLLFGEIPRPPPPRPAPRRAPAAHLLAARRRTEVRAHVLEATKPPPEIRVHENFLSGRRHIITVR